MCNSAWFGSKYDYIKIPKKLVLERSSYEGLDSDAIFLYGYLFTKTQQSYGNKQYHDSYGVYVVDNFKQLFNWGKDLTADRLKKLEKLGLIKIRLSSRNSARRVYVQDFNSDAPATKYFSSQSVFNLQFFSVPTALFFNMNLFNLSTDAVLLYGVLLDFLSMSKMDIGTSYYDSELDAYFLTKDHSYFINLFGWSSTKYSRIQKSLVDNSLIMVDRVGKTQRNRIYPIDVLSFTDIKNNKEKTENEVIYQINDSDLSKSAYQNSVESTDLSKSDEGFIKIRQVIYQNPPSDLSKSDTNRLIFSNLNFSNLNISNHIEILKNDSIGYIQHSINSRNDFKRMDTKTKVEHSEALYFFMLDSIFEETLTQDHIDLFVEYQMNFKDNFQTIQSTIENLKFEDSTFNSAWIHYFDEAARLLIKTKDILRNVYAKDQGVLKMFKNLGVNETTAIKNLLKLSPDQLIGAVARVHKYFDFTKNVISNLDAFLLKTLINVASNSISFENYYDYSHNLIHLIEQPDSH